MITISYALAGVLAVAIIAIGIRFLVAPTVAAAGYGVPLEIDRPGARAYSSVKGIRDIATGVIVIVLMLGPATHPLGWAMLAATIIPLGDAAVVLRNGGARSVAYGVHGGTAAVMLLTTSLLLTS